MNWCPKCRKFSVSVLTVYRGKLVCKNCKNELERKEKQKTQHFN